MIIQSSFKFDRPLQLPLIIKTVDAVSLDYYYDKIVEYSDKKAIPNPNNSKYPFLFITGLFTSNDKNYKGNYYFAYSPLLNNRFFNPQEFCFKSFDIINEDLKTKSPDNKKVIYLDKQQFEQICQNYSINTWMHNWFEKWLRKKLRLAMLEETMDSYSKAKSKVGLKI